MEEKMNSLLKIKAWKLVRKQLDLKNVKYPKHKLTLEFEIEDLESSNKILGMEIKRARSHRRLLLCQNYHMERLPLKFEMTNLESISVTLTLKVNLSSKGNPQNEAEQKHIN